MAKPFKPGFFSNLNGVKDNNDRPPLAGGGGGAGTFNNLGSGQGQVFKQVLVNDVQFRTLRAGSGVTITQDANEVTISATGGGGAGGMTYTDANRKWFEFEDFTAFDAALLGVNFFTAQTSGTGAAATNVNNQNETLRGTAGVFKLESGTTSTGFSQLVTNIDSTQNSLPPGGKAYAQARFFIKQLPNLGGLLALTLFGENATGLGGSTGGIQLNADLAGSGNWQLIVASSLASNPDQILDTGIPVDLTIDAIQEIELLFDDVARQARVVVNGIPYTSPTTLGIVDLQHTVTSSLTTFRPFRFGVYNNALANTVETVIGVDSIGFGLDLTGATGSGARRPITLF